MTTLFLTCAVLGGSVLVLQLLLSMLGVVEHELGLDTLSGHHLDGPGDALNLKSVRALAAGVAFFGLGGLLVLSVGVPAPVAAAFGAVLGGAATVLVAMASRAMLRLESDGSLNVHNSIGEPGRVYLGIPGGRSAPGKVHLVVQGRTVEMKAVSEHALATGAPVVVVDVLGPDIVEVAPSLPHGGSFDVLS